MLKKKYVFFFGAKWQMVRGKKNVFKVLPYTLFFFFQTYKPAATRIRRNECGRMIAMV